MGTNVIRSQFGAPLPPNVPVNILTVKRKQPTPAAPAATAAAAAAAPGDAAAPVADVDTEGQAVKKVRVTDVL
jgi:hypothetical protein